MARPTLGTAVREGARSGVVVGHPGRGNMVDVQFRDVSFVERRDAGRLTPIRANTNNHQRAMVEAVYERLVTEHLGKKSFRNAKGQRIDVLALNKGTLTREEVNDLVGRAFAIMKARGTNKRSRRDVLRLDDYEETLALRRVENPRGGREPRPPLRRNFVGGAARAGASALRAGGALVRFGAANADEALKAARAFLKTPAGERLAARITATAVALFGREAVSRGTMTAEEAAVVQRAVSRREGEEIEPELVLAALHAKARKSRVHQP